MMDEVFPYLAKCVGRVVLKKKTGFRAESDISRYYLPDRGEAPVGGDVASASW